MPRLLAPTFVFLLLGLPWWAHGATKKSFDNAQPIDITSQSLTLDRKARQALFRGTVEVRQGALYIKSHNVKARYLDTPNKDRGVARTITHIEATGDVVFMDRLTARIVRADRAVYDITKRVITMLGAVSLWQRNSIVRGHKIVIDIDAQTTVIESNPEGENVIEGLFLSTKSSTHSPKSAP